MRTFLLGLAILLAGCGDPVRSDAIDALPGETPGVPKGPLHRPGQPCLLCHDGEGPGNSVFSLAGTIYQTQGSTVPLSDALVKFVDSTGKRYEIGSNCAGNFFVMQDDFAPSYPVWVKVVFGQAGASPVERAMGTPTYREGSCAHCHTSQASPDSPGPVYFAPQGVPFPRQCQQ